MLAQTNHQTTKKCSGKLMTGDLFTNGENLTAKIPPIDFQVTTPKTPLLSQQAVTSKWMPSTLPTYSWTLTPIPNWTCSVVIVPLFDARLPSMWQPTARILLRDFNHQLRRLLAAKFFSSSTRWRSRRCLVTKPYGTHTQQLHQEKKMNYGKNFVFGHNLFEQSLLNTCATCELPDDP